MSEKIILSTDPGIDDAMAIIFLSKLDYLKVIWTTMGNNSLENCTNNALKILELVGRKDVPIIKGAAHALSQRKGFYTHFHGRHGLGNINLPLPKHSEFSWETIDYIISAIDDNPREMTFLSIGPLTNLANLLQIAPVNTINQIKKIIVMGGALTVSGNVTPYAEYNIYCDPHAAKVVFNSGLPITLVGLDVTHEAILTEAHIKQLEAEKTPLTDFVVGIARFYSKMYRNIDGCPIHDPLAAAVAVDPTIVKTKLLNLDVIVENSNKFGQVFNLESTKSPSISVCLEVNSEKFLDLFIRTLVG